MEEGAGLAAFWKEAGGWGRLPDITQLLFYQKCIFKRLGSIHFSKTAPVCVVSSAACMSCRKRMSHSKPKRVETSGHTCHRGAQWRSQTFPEKRQAGKPQTSLSSTHALPLHDSLSISSPV